MHGGRSRLSSPRETKTGPWVLYSYYGKNSPQIGLLFRFSYLGPYQKPPKNPVFLFVWKIRHIMAPFAKIRQISTSPNGHQRP